MILAICRELSEFLVLMLSSLRGESRILKIRDNQKRILITDGSLKPKARLVVRGFQEAGLQDLDTFSSACSKSSWRVLLTVVMGSRGN